MLGFSGGGAMAAMEVTTAPGDHDSAPVEATTKRSANIGPRDPEKEKAHGIGVDVFLNKNLAVSSSLALLPSDPYQQSGQGGLNEVLGLNTSQLGGAVGLKVRF